MLVQTKLVVLREAVHQNAILAFENTLDVDLLLSCLGSFILEFSSNNLVQIKSRSI